ncbi:hypothetical protein B0H13DRAFT_882199 [Mycena leptocephala]|nr:hypothetical protein B0H13DRAFT_882199 [Mycena leptocephala]
MHRRARKTFYPIARIKRVRLATQSHRRVDCASSTLALSHRGCHRRRGGCARSNVPAMFHHTLRRADRTQASASAPSPLRAHTHMSRSQSLYARLQFPTPRHTCGAVHKHCHSCPTHPPPSRARTSMPASSPANGSLAISAPGYSRRTQPIAPAPRTGTCPAHKKTRQSRGQPTPPLRPHPHPTAPWW